MQNHFYFSSHVLLLFKEWKVDSVGVLVGVFVGLFLFTLINEIARFYQSRFVNSAGTPGTRLTTSSHQIYNQDEGTYRYGTFGSGDVTSAPSNQNAEHAIPLHVRVRVAWTPRYILSSLSFPLLVAANYFIMFAVMTYNAWLLVAVCLASGLAYFLLQSDHDVPAVKCHRDGQTTPLLPSSDEI